MKKSYFNPEVHSLPFSNFSHEVWGVSWGFQCGGMCTIVLRRFYDGILIDCEAKRESFEDDIWDAQFYIISKDCYKSCHWGKSIKAVEELSERIDIGKPTLLYLNQEDDSLVADHYVIAYAMEEKPDGIKKIFTYDPNYVYKRCYCNAPNVTDKIKNGDTWLELDYNQEIVTKVSSNVQTVRTVIPGFKRYENISDFVHEKNIQHSCEINRLSLNPPTIINNTPVISHSIKISKDGSVAADLKLAIQGNQDLFEQGDNLYPSTLMHCFGSTSPNDHHKHLGLQSGAGVAEIIYNFFEEYDSTNSPITLQSNFIEKNLALGFPKPRIETFTAFADNSTHQRLEMGYTNRQGIGNVFEIQGLNMDNVVECEKVPDNYQSKLPVNIVSFVADDYKSAINLGTYDLFKPLFYLGYVRSNVLVELAHNGLYSGGTVKMNSYNPTSIENKEFVEDAVIFTLPGGTQELYNSDALKANDFVIKGKDVSSQFSESLSAILQYRCLIIHEPLIHRPHTIKDFDVFAKYFLKILINIPNSPLGTQLKNKFKLELAKNPRIEKKKFEEFFNKKFIDTLSNEIRTFNNPEQLKKDIFDSFQLYDNYIKERMYFILSISKNFQGLLKNSAILEDQIVRLIGLVLTGKKSFNDVITNNLKHEWR